MNKPSLTKQNFIDLLMSDIPILKPNNCDIKDVRSLIVSFRDGMSYDDNTQISSEGRYTVILKLNESENLLHTLINIDIDMVHDNKDFCNIVSIIKKIGYSQTTFNFECCGGCTKINTEISNDIKKYNKYNFCNEDISQNVITLVDYVLDHGSCVMFADFSFKALINNWHTENWGICPFRNISKINGIYNVSYPLEETKKSQFGQLAQIAKMVEPDDNKDSNDVSCFSMKVNTLQGTLVYDIRENIDPNITLYVHSVIQDTKNINCKYIPSVAYGSSNIKGLPVHTVVNFKNKTGIMILSNIHFKELVDVNANINSVISSASNILGKQRSGEMVQQLSSVKCPKLIRSITSSYVAEITNGSNPINRTLKKAKTGP